MRRIAYRLLCRCGELAGRHGNAFRYVAAGFLRTAELQSASVTEWRTFNAAPNQVDEGLTPDEEKYYSRFLSHGSRVLLVGCGTGRDLIGLIARGHTVTGLDQDPAVIDVARSQLLRHGLTADLVAVPIQDAALSGTFDAVIFSNGCYSFIRGRDTRIAVLRRVRRHLSQGGRVVLSYHARAPQSATTGWLTYAASRLSGADWRPERGDVFARHTTAPGLLRYRHDFVPREFQEECREAAFRVVADDESADVLRFAVAEPADVLERS